MDYFPRVTQINKIILLLLFSAIVWGGVVNKSENYWNETKHKLAFTKPCLSKFNFIDLPFDRENHDFYLAKHYRKLHLIALTEEHYKKALINAPYSKTISLDFAHFLIFQKKSLGESKEILKAIHESQPEHLATRSLLALIAIESKEFDSYKSYVESEAFNSKWLAHRLYFDLLLKTSSYYVQNTYNLTDIQLENIPLSEKNREIRLLLENKINCLYMESWPFPKRDLLYYEIIKQCAQIKLDDWLKAHLLVSKKG